MYTAKNRWGGRSKRTTREIGNEKRDPVLIDGEDFRG